LSAKMDTLTLTLDLDASGLQVGDAMLKWSDNSNPLGYHPVPMISLKNGVGPTLLIIGGTHGDEFEGVSAIMRLVATLDPKDISGQIILLPAFNSPAVAASSRVSPLDGENLNRAFPGNDLGGPTAMLANFAEQLMPRCDAVIDLHSGGKASFFQPCTLISEMSDAALSAASDDLARAFGLPLVWMLGKHNDKRSVNGAAERVGVPMIATELGGGGGVDPEITNLTEAGLRNCLVHLGIMKGPDPRRDIDRRVSISSPLHSIFAPSDGLFDRQVSAGQDMSKGQFAGTFHFPLEPKRTSIPLTFPTGGFVLAHGNRGMVRRGELLALIAQDVPD
jgi:predicted deacylase